MAEALGPATGDVSARRLFGLALPALGVLVAEPVYLLFDAAVVGRLGAGALAGLAVGGIVLAQVSTALTFLSYGTTSRAARLHGAGRDRDAVAEGVQATWLAVGIGVVLLVAVQLFASPILGVIGGGGDISTEAERWLRIAVVGAPLILITLAGNGWMRGVQDTVRPLRFVVAGVVVSTALCPVLVFGWSVAPDMGLEGSAVANVVGQFVAATLFVSAILRERVPLGVRLPVMRAQLVLGRDLILRTAAFQVCFLSATTVAARFGAAAVGAHQLVLQLWNLVALILDSLAIAAQALTGAALGASHGDVVMTLARRVTLWSTAAALGLAAAFAATYPVLPGVFTDDLSVQDEMRGIWWLFVAMIPLAGVVFALDGVLLGAGDAAFLRTATLVGALLGFLPFVWLSLTLDWGLAGIWVGLAVFIIVRLIAVVARTVSGKWITVGVENRDPSNKERS
ncbi:MATE family efflux transporter [Rhodococcoides trifolii]|uniref:MATE family efflux transporter n=1 Tax=Rhodococcoides trifolii TaxID=908250 RepID=A0A917D1U7_9NOCA|nr:MATE family efflux transporter [Rhodococcus trifolii]GGG07663.1 MATE family efflux transporter [Rhodococcus trifolii]